MSDSAKNYRFSPFAHNRLVKIADEIGRGTYPSTRQLAEIAECSERTVRRYLAELRNAYSAPLKHDKRRSGYYFSLPWSFSQSAFTEGELLAFFLAERVLKTAGRSTEADLLHAALAKLAARLPATVSVNLTRFGESLSFESSPSVLAEPAYLRLLASAAAAQETLEIVYHTQQTDTVKTRRINPLLLHNHADDWYVVAFDYLRREIRDFHVGRIRSVRQTSEYFELPKNWNAEEYVKSGFLMTRGGRRVRVSLLFDAFQSRWMNERTAFHRDERREILEDGSLRIAFTVESEGLEAVARYFMQWADHCRFEEPPKLKQIIQEKLKKGIKLTDEY